MYAIVMTGGKQYMVNEGDEFKVEKLPAEIGSEINLDVVAVSDGTALKVGDDAKDAVVKAEVVGSGRGEKVIVFKYKPKKDYRRKKGHRQPFTKLKITSIQA